MEPESIKKKLTEKEAQRLYELLGRLNSEISKQLSENGFTPEGTDYTTVVRHNHRDYLEDRYDVKDSDDN